ncbi:hypothetical protein DY000_02033035 [Brassica cretica]|uniref:Uncharacterized protein n=1 Tax=Brassica cretica TaxID=69181 RepID=A0ABQ7DFZ4_BRACR|nr:hypothetical protein DY000_02033035 [Brassica cretica]
MITACGVTHRSTRWNGKTRGVAMHATRPCGQTCGGRGVSLHGARPCIQTGMWCGVILHETDTCSQPCGARGVAAHASGAMRSDTWVATRLVPDCTWRRFCSSEERSVLVDTSSRPVWTWVNLRRSRKGSDRRSRVWGQGHGQPKTLANAECLDDIAKLWIVRGRGVILHETETCSQPCGARGVAAHASGAMRSDTRAATRLVPDCTWRRFCSSEERSVLVETSSRPVWTWVYLRRSRKCSDRRSRGPVTWKLDHGRWPGLTEYDLVPGGFKETPYSLDREDSDEWGHVLSLSITRRCNVAVTRRTVGRRAVTRRTVGRGRLKVPSSGLCGRKIGYCR